VSLRPTVERDNDEMVITWQGSFASERYGDTELSLILSDVPRPRCVILSNGRGSRDLEPGHSHFWTRPGQLLINVPTNARSIHIAF
jgi:hypothetical protein